MFSLCQAGFLKIPRVRKYFNIPKVPPPPKKKKPDKGFREGLKESKSRLQMFNFFFIKKKKLNFSVVELENSQRNEFTTDL